MSLDFGLQFSLGSRVSRGIPIESSEHPNLVAMFTMDNVTGGNLLIDESAYIHDTVVQGHTFVSGKIADAVDFSGTSSGGYRSITAAFRTQELTVNFWANADTLHDATIISGLPRKAVNDARGIAVTLDSSGFVKGRAGVASDGNWRFTTTGSAISAGVWYMYTLVANDTDLLLYRDGSQIGSVTLAGLTIEWDDGTTGEPNPGQIYLGGEHENTFSGPAPDRLLFDGKIDQFRWYDRELTPGEISRLYNGGSGR